MAKAQSRSDYMMSELLTIVLCVALNKQPLSS